jgi:hypothetical protein
MKKTLGFLAIWLLSITTTYAQAVVDATVTNLSDAKLNVKDQLFKIADVQDLDALTLKYQDIFNDANVKSYFSMAISAPSHIGVTSSKVVGQNIYHAFEMGAKVSTLFSNLLHCNENQIELPKSLNNKVLSYCFKESGLTGKEEGEKLLMQKLLENLKLKTRVTQALQDVLVIDVVDTNKLNLAKAAIKNGTGITEVNTKGKNAILIENGTLGTLSVELKRTLTQEVKINRKDLYTDHYDFNLENDTFESLQQSLLTYGLSLKKEQKSLQKYNFEE